MSRWTIVAALLLAGCGASTESVTEQAIITKEQPAPEAAASKALHTASLPQIAYEFRLGYRLPPAQVAAAQVAHLKLCDAMGPAKCRLIGQARNSGEDQVASGELVLDVESSAARAFADRMDAAITSVSGEVGSRSITAEDLSKSIVDTEARLRSKQLLADRLLLLLRTRTGKVGELVEAERAAADVQEEIDAARSGLAAMRGRVAMSRITATYQSNGMAGNGALAPARDALASASRTLAQSLAVLISLVAAALPWVLVIAVGLLLARQIRRYARRAPTPRSD